MPFSACSLNFFLLLYNHFSSLELAISVFLVSVVQSPVPRQQHCSQPFCIQPLLCNGSADLGSGLPLPAALPSLDTNEEAKELLCLWPAGRAPKQAAHPPWRSELCPAALPQFQQPGAWSKGCSCCFCSTGTRRGQGRAHRRAAAALHLPCLRDRSITQTEPAADSFTACGPALLGVLPSTPCSEGPEAEQLLLVQGSLTP